MMKGMYNLIPDFSEAKSETSAIAKIQTGLDFLSHMKSYPTKSNIKLGRAILESIRSLAVKYGFVKDTSEIDNLVKTRTSFVDYLNSKSRRKPQEDDSIYSIPTDDNL